MHGRSCPSSIPRYEVLFLVESTTDPAWEVLNRILADVPGARASLIITGTAEGCSQKIHNLLVGLEHVAPETTHPGLRRF